MARKIKIFDTTLRDGEQTPGVSLTVEEKIEIAKQLARLNVDVIEAGFPISSPGEFEAVKRIAREVRGPTIAALARAVKKDIDAAGEALKDAESKRIHTFIATSLIHMKYKLRKTPEEVKKMAVEAVEYATKYTDDIEFSAEDATRSDWNFLVEVYEAVIDAGATTINVPDTVGYTTPEEFYELIRYLKRNITNLNGVTISVHCHNDLGLAVANSLSAVRAGADQVEVTVNGIGERAGNAALEEVVVALDVRKDFYNVETGINLGEIARTSKLVARLTGIEVPPNKAVVGANAFAHESGIHQDGVLKERTTYEIIDPRKLGFSGSKIVLGKHSGRHAFRKKLEEMGYRLSEEEINRLFAKFKEIADRKKGLTELDIEAIVQEELGKGKGKYSVEVLHVISGKISTATVRVQGDGIDKIESAWSSNGPIDALFAAINRALGIDCKLKEYRVSSVTSGRDALGEVLVRVEYNGEIYVGRGLSTDIIEASAQAYLSALNRIRR
ncbi:2-isopropylmalate synthase [Pyrococcus furiosus DSM 3638]|uniref:2-isopropylmalate synthase n=3 Tax=Pyrococcus furiosus TaxID=2261 RepID=LEU1_PYRFU|nr:MULTISPECIES: 2-isopropylmalate synthase [Pyrococcus]Q8U2A2.1 RecName: Full=2-isopropylmalate synthase; AltName: Full=Alpha-IPM synthase; AltName: Full=Alpha-isopropylmalate synthase [Pyrococcus furiosus DSM 3638]AAL81061.1 2-isopropylmalate synthase [Pyrococcus furiosus DSM 3638]MDK2869722.1 2-isopropylmalate synthase [Pyrococcus sp.]QEK78603.1 2-isopropylmalate synthase [Pyrococcus furiosus DSM 3638]